MHRLALSTSLLAGITALLCLGPAQAAAYKWVDANGNVQYTQTPPPPGTKAEVVKPRGPAAAEAAAPAGPTPDEEDAALRKQQEEDELKAELLKKEEAREAEKARINQQNCKAANEYKAYLNSRPLRNMPAPDGIEQGRMTPEQHEAELARAQKTIDESCAQPAGGDAPATSAY